MGAMSAPSAAKRFTKNVSIRTAGLSGFVWPSAWVSPQTRTLTFLANSPGANRTVPSSSADPAGSVLTAIRGAS